LNLNIYKLLCLCSFGIKLVIFFTNLGIIILFNVVLYAIKKDSSLELSPTNIIIEIVGLISAIVGIVRIDLKKDKELV
jgi:hypothetical protein